MSIDSVLKTVILNALPVERRAGSAYSMDDIIRRQLDEAMVSVSEWHGSGCLLTDIGEFLIRSSTLVSRVADGMVRGQHVQVNTRQVIAEMDEEHDFSELELLDYMNQRHSLLKSISEALQVTARNVSQVWDEAPPPPIRHRRVSAADPIASPPSHDLPIGGEDARSAQSPPQALAGLQELRIEPLGSFTEHEGNRPPLSPVEDAQLPLDAANARIASLNVRGKGSHVCPYGAACKKGGVRVTGELVVFERNCAFRAHWQKHAKPFKCKFPGCSNKDGFARIDQLRRHQLVVKHGKQIDPARSPVGSETCGVAGVRFQQIATGVA